MQTINELIERYGEDVIEKIQDVELFPGEDRSNIILILYSDKFEGLAEQILYPIFEDQDTFAKIMKRYLPEDSSYYLGYDNKRHKKN